MLNAQWGKRLLLAALLFTGVQGAAWAQATRTWVSGVGDDANPCSRTAPCKTFAGAISKTAAGGEISVLDPGGFGTVTITKSITLNADGVVAGILSSFTNGITINAAATDRVTLRGLNIEGASTGINGIRILSAAEVVVEDCHIQGFSGANPSTGILLATTTGTTRLSVRNTRINSNGQAFASNGGIVIKPGGSSTAIADLDKVNLANNSAGLITNSTATTGSVFATIRDSQVTGNSLDGIYAVASATGNHRVAVKTNTIADNAFNSMTGAGVHATGAAANIRIQDNVITANRIGVSLDSSGVIYSYGSNIISGNGTNGSFTSTQPTQ